MNNPSSKQPMLDQTASQKVQVKKAVVFTSGSFSLPLIQTLLQEGKLAGVILPDPSEVPHIAGEISGVAAQLQQAKIPYQLCCKAKLPLIVEQLDAWQADIGLIATFSHLIPREVCEFFQYGLYNFHGSALPSYKGPMPIYWQIRNQEKTITLCVHKAEQNVDSGSIVLSKTLPLHPLDTLQSASNQLAKLACAAAGELFEQISIHAGPPVGTPQLVEGIQNKTEKKGEKYAHYPNLDDGIIDPNTMTAEEISAICRASGSGAFSASISLNGVPISVLEASPVDYPSFGTKPGTVLFIGDPEGFIIQVKGSSVRLDVLANADGIYSGYAFAERFKIDAGMQMQASLFTMQQQ